MICEHTTFSQPIYFFFFLREREQGSEAGRIKKEILGFHQKGTISYPSTSETNVHLGIFCFRFL